MGRGGRIGKQLSNDLKETRRYGKLKETSLDPLRGKFAVEEVVEPSQEKVRDDDDDDDDTG